MRKAYSIHSASFPKQASVHKHIFFMVLEHVLPFFKKSSLHLKTKDLHCERLSDRTGKIELRR